MDATKKQDEEKTKEELISELETLRKKLNELQSEFSRPTRGLSVSQIRELAEEREEYEPDWGPNYAGS